MKILIILIAVFSTQSFAQGLKLEWLDTIPGKFDHFSIDNLQRIYTTEKDVIRVYQNADTAAFVESLKTMVPYSIESSKSLRTLVFDQERSIVQFFDNTLTNIYGEIDLYNYGIYQGILVCESFVGNSFWVFDVNGMRLIKFNQNMEITTTIENLTNVFENNSLPTQMLERNDQLFLLVPEKAVFIFDAFGTYLSSVPIKSQQIQVANQKIFYIHENKLKMEPINFADPADSIDIPENCNRFAIQHNFIYLLCKEGIIKGKIANK